MSNQPLAGIRVLDLGHEWSCPHTARLLADFGAEVIKIEYPKRLDLTRGIRTDDRIYDRQINFWQVHRNKRSLTLDLKNPEHLEIFKDLVRISDLVLENSRPGVVVKLGLGYEQLKQLNPQIIMISMSAFGQTGPESTYAGYGGSIEAIAGIQSLTAYSSTSPPRRIREMDVTNGILGACAAMTALIKRQETGLGEWVDLAEVEAASHSLIGEHLLAFDLNGAIDYPMGNRHPEYVPHGCYRCLGDDQWLAIAVQTDLEWQTLCSIIQQPQWVNDPQYATAAVRREYHDQIDLAIEAWTTQHPPDEAMHILQNAGIAAGTVLTTGDLCNDPHLQARHYFQTPSQNPDHGNFLGFPFELSGGGGELKQRGPDLGADNHYIVCELLGYPEDRVPKIVESELGTSFDS